MNVHTPCRPRVLLLLLLLLPLGSPSARGGTTSGGASSPRFWASSRARRIRNYYYYYYYYYCYVTDKNQQKKKCITMTTPVTRITNDIHPRDYAKRMRRKPPPEREAKPARWRKLTQPLRAWAPLATLPRRTPYTAHLTNSATIAASAITAAEHQVLRDVRCAR